ncbi:MAG TPA: FkbM family methyltransferase [Bryobacteraceae bacterium]
METVSEFAASFRRLANRDDFRRNPLKAVLKRVIWRARWIASSKPVELHHQAGFSLFATKGASAALIYYLGSSEPETAAFITGFLKPGMVFFDAGAHIGEYTVMAASSVGADGQVHAFEAQPATAELLRRSCDANRLQNAVVNTCAVSDHEGELEFDICSDPTMSAIATPTRTRHRSLGRIRVPAITLDAYCERTDVWPDLLKIDVEGAELRVLQGAAGILGRPLPPAVLFECLAVTYKRFGYSPQDVIDFLRGFGYRIYRLTEGGKLVPHVSPVSGALGYNLVALKP